MDCSTRKGEKVKGVRIGIREYNGKINNMTTHQKKKQVYIRKFSLFGKSSGLTLLASNPVIGTWYSGLWGKGTSPLVGQFVGEMAGGYFFSCFSWSYGLSITSGTMNWSHQMAGLWAAFGIFCPQGRLQL
jgi:hypothetical protein